MSQALSSHAAAMDRIYRWQGAVYDVTRKHYLLGRDRLIAELAPPPGAHVLEIGCGTGRNLVRAARLYPQAHFCGIDISRAMLARAAKSVRRAGLQDRIVLAQGDATSFDAQSLFGVAHFERVFCSYTLSMIPPWQAALAHAACVVAPGGELAVVDFGRMERLPRWFKAAMKTWLAKFSVSPRASLGDAMAKLEGFALGSHDLYRGYAHYSVAEKASIKA
jgi:S-adenosylmethionine-diacylgycerolhomoserine-N-methlytransferase